jgi:hypothetical protein
MDVKERMRKHSCDGKIKNAEELALNEILLFIRRGRLRDGFKLLGNN